MCVANGDQSGKFNPKKSFSILLIMSNKLRYLVIAHFSITKYYFYPLRRVILPYGNQRINFTVTYTFWCKDRNLNISKN